MEDWWTGCRNNMRIKTAFFLMILFLSYVAVPWQVVSAQEEVNCTFRQDGGWTEYSVPEHQATDCNFSWSNNSGHVISNNLGQDETVLNSSESSVRIRGCSESMGYWRDCISEGTPRVSSCNITCRNLQPSAQEYGYLAYIAAAAFVLLVLGVIFMLYKCFIRQSTSTAGSPDDVEARHLCFSACRFSSVPSDNV